MLKKIQLIFPMLLIGLISEAQQVIYTTSQNYNQLKANGQLNLHAKYKFLNTNSVNSNIANTNTNKQPLNTSKTSSTSACACMQPVDNTFTVVPMGTGGIFDPQPPEYRNDDDYSASIPLGFNFCFYGNIYNACYINNNGNITFDNGLASFSAGGFPAGNDTVMIAPFWGDVDTQGPGSGLVYYKKTPTALIVKWNNVGYFSSQDDKLNDFQLIITNGSDPILPNGNNVAFCYGDMQWTTGSASQGTNGFGGIPSTAGVNKGDDVNFIQLGRFDQVGLSYDGPYGLSDGISFLDNKSYFFNTCGTNNNLPPIIQDATGGGSACGDTLRICALGDTLVYTTSFLGPESTQSVSISTSATSLGNSFIPLGITSTNGGVTTYAWMVVASSTVTGIHTVSITGTDNGNPPLSTTATYFIKIQNITVPQPTLSVSPSGTICSSPGATLSLVNCSSYDNVYWSNGSSGCNTFVNATGKYFVTVNKLGCFKSSSDSIKVYANPKPILSGPTNYCSPATSTTIMIDPPASGMAAYNSFSWLPSGLTNDTVALTIGNHNVIVTDINGCTGQATISITSATPSVSITATPLALCGGTGSSTLIASISGASNYVWSNSATTQTIVINSSGVYGVTVTASGCVASKTINILSVPITTITLPNNIGLCNGSSATIIPTITPGTSTITTYNWSNGVHSSTLPVFTSGFYSLHVIDNYGCLSAISNSCNVFVAPNPTVTINNTPLYFCNGAFATLTPTINGGTANYNYAWSPFSLGVNSTATVNTTGTYTVNVSDANLCKGSATISVIKNTPSVSLSSTDLILCPGDCTVLNATANSSFTPIIYSWSNSSSSISSANYCTVGTKTVTITDAKGCVASNTITITSDVLPIASFIGTPVSPVNVGDIISFVNTSTISVGSIISANWNFGDGGNASTYNANYAYTTADNFVITLIVTGSNGCKDTVSSSYKVEAILTIPNVITPNGDGKNDFLKFQNLQLYKTNDITIYNRWGNKIYSQTNYKNDWNATGVSDGTYFFILNVPEASPVSYQGYFQIIR